MESVRYSRESQQILSPLSSLGLIDRTVTREDKADRYCYPVDDYSETYVAYSAPSEGTDTEVFF